MDKGRYVDRLVRERDREGWEEGRPKVVGDGAGEVVGDGISEVCVWGMCVCVWCGDLVCVRCACGCVCVWVCECDVRVKTCLLTGVGGMVLDLYQPEGR